MEILGHKGQLEILELKVTQGPQGLLANRVTLALRETQAFGDFKVIQASLATQALQAFKDQLEIQGLRVLKVIQV